MPADSDLVTLGAFLADFDAYLKSDVVFWPMGGKAHMPALTLGGLLFVRRRLSARQARLDPARLTEYTALDREADSSFARWPVNIEKKAVKEISSRLNVWASALDECTDSPAACAENYSASVTNRVYLAMLLPMVEKVAAAEAHRSRLALLDQRLRNLIISGEFVWDAELVPAFPQQEFWFLYGRPQAKGLPKH